MIKINKKEAEQLVELLQKQIAKSDEGSPVEIAIDKTDINVTVKSHGGWLRSGVYRRQNPMAVAIEIKKSIDAGKKLKKLMAWLRHANHIKIICLLRCSVVYSDMQTKELSKEVKAIAHRILRERMKKEGVVTPKVGWATEAVKQAQKENV